jgi:alanine racemase
MDNKRRSWAEIDLGAIEHNLTAIRSCLTPQTRVMAVIKANAYGHGVMEVARLGVKLGADFLGVATLEEAMPLVEVGITLPILVLGYVPRECAEQVIKNKIRTVVYETDYARALSQAAQRLSAEAVVHIKVDTGMGRLGFADNAEGLQSVIEVAALPGINVEGLMTHFAEADSPVEEFTRLQIERFRCFAADLELRGLYIPLKHCANDAAIVCFPEAHFDMVRTGIMMYGLYPSDSMKGLNLDIIPAMTLKSRISFIKTMAQGESVSYGRTYRCPEDTRVATVPIGYGDGYSRLLSNRAYAIIKGIKAPLIGTVCMDQCMFALPEKADLQVGDEVILFGKPEEGITADDLAQMIGTINYEIVTTITARVPRSYQP